MMNSKLSSKANSQEHVSFQRADSACIEQNKNIRSPPKDVPEGSESEKENSQESRKGQKKLSRSSQIVVNKSSIPADFSLTVAPILFYDRFQELNPFASIRRLPRKYARIPATQQEMLDRNEAWYNPTTDGRPRYANIPDGVRSDLLEFMNSTSGTRSAMMTSQDSGSAEESSVEDESNSEAESEQVRKKETEIRDGRVPAQSKRLYVKPIGEPSQVEQEESGPEDKNGRVWRSSHYSHHEDQDGSDGDAVSCASSHHSEETVQKSCKRSTSGDKGGESSQDTKPGSEALPVISNSSALQIKTLQSMQKRIDIPASSPGDEADLEVAYPYAVGDAVVEIPTVSTAQQAKTPRSSASQDIPSTAPRKRKVIEVQRTPFPSYGRRTSRTEAPMRAKQVLTSGLSDPVIPATFDDTNSNAPESSHELPDSATVNRAPHAQYDTNSHNPNAEDENLKGVLSQHPSPETLHHDHNVLPQSLPAQPSTPRGTQGVRQLDNTVPDGDISAEPSPAASVLPRMSPPQVSILSFSSRITHHTRELDLTASNNNAPKSIPATLQDVSCQAIGISGVPNSDVNQMLTTEEPRKTLKRSISDQATRNNNFSKKARMSLGDLAREDDSPPKDISEMARQSRLSFNGRIKAEPAVDSFPSSPKLTGNIYTTNKVRG